MFDLKNESKHDEKNHDLLFSHMREYSPSISCDKNNGMGTNDVVKPRSVKITTITSSLNDIVINKPPLLSDVFDDANTPMFCINTTDKDDIEESSSYNIKRYCQVFYNTLWKYTPLLYSWRMKI